MHPYPTLRLTEAPGATETRREARPTREARRYRTRPSIKRTMRRRLKRHDRARWLTEEWQLLTLEANQAAQEWAVDTWEYAWGGL